VLELQSLRDRTDRRPPAPWQPFEGQQQLVLLRLDLCGPCRRLTEVQEASHDVAQLGQGAIFA
jgi:hypothetical protein